MSLHERYCQAFGIERKAPSLSLVEELVSNHLANYTFSNTEILLHPTKSHSLEPEALMEKIVVGRKGGYCFEHNNLMYHVLSGLGFDVHTHLARVVYGEEVDVPRTHQFNVVRIDDKEYLVDVGFGPYTPSVPVPFEKNENCPYSIVKDGNRYALNSPRDGKEFVFYTFILDECTPADFKLSHYYTSTHPDSKFVTTLVASRICADKTAFINDYIFSTIVDGKKTTKEVETEAEFFEIIIKEVGLNYSDVDVSNLYQFVERKRSAKSG